MSGPFRLLFLRGEPYPPLGGKGNKVLRGYVGAAGLGLRPGWPGIDQLHMASQKVCSPGSVSFPSPD